MKTVYVPKNFIRKHRKIIERADAILSEYMAQGLVITLRTLYYQFVARGYCPNRQKEYNNLGNIIGEARLAGMIDWEALEDRTRNLQALQHFSGPQDALNKLRDWYHVDMWKSQKVRPEVWIEKDALVGVIQKACEENDVPYFSCRGYTSLSEMWRASLRLRRYLDAGQTPIIIHFGDHDPSGIDMSRDIEERLSRIFWAPCTFIRVALNWDQIEEYNPPPNPAKVTDSRYRKYAEEFGEESWELDALPPMKLGELIRDNLLKHRDEEQWAQDEKERARVKAQLADLAEEWKNLPEQKKRLAFLAKTNNSQKKTIEAQQEEIQSLKKVLEQRKKHRPKEP